MNPIPFAVAAAVLLVIGAGLLWGARRKDARNYILAKATPLPLALANVRDDVWLDGIAVCDQPVTIPHFGIRAIHYDWKRERRERRTHRDSKGRTHTQTVWVTEQSASETAPFRLVEGSDSEPIPKLLRRPEAERGPARQGGPNDAYCGEVRRGGPTQHGGAAAGRRQDEFWDRLSIEVRAERAKFDGLESVTEQVGDRRHSAHYFPMDVNIRAVGTISEGRRFLEPFANIPLIITRRTREAYLRSAERGESALRFFGFFFAWLALGMGAWVIIAISRAQPRFPGEPAIEVDPIALLAAAGIGLIAILPLLIIHIRNTLLGYRIRVENAWRQVDVDLMQRYDLIPRLAEVARGYAAFERGTLEALARLRDEAIAGGRRERIAVERSAAGGVADLIARIERYPDLKAQPVFAKLHEELVAIEEKIAHGRSTYNDAVREFNDTVQTFPRSLVASLLGLRAIEHFSMGA